MDILKIGETIIDPPIALAPMAGVTDAAFRAVCREAGASLTYTEMVSSRGLVYQDKKTNQLLALTEGEHPSAVQIFGNDPEVMAQAAQLALERSGADFIDINMGCPTPKITSNGDGCALMRDIELASLIIDRVASSCSAPVTVKFRKGWDSGSVNAVEFAKMAEKSGAAAVCVHGRTRSAMYSGRADWDVIRDVAESVAIPVIANGDVFSAEDCAAVMRRTGAAGVMIGRGAFGNPWIFTQARAALAGEASAPIPSLTQRLEVAERQVRMSAEMRGERVAVLEARRHLNWYLRGVRGASLYKNRVTQLQSLEELHRLIREICGT